MSSSSVYPTNDGASASPRSSSYGPTTTSPFKSSTRTRASLSRATRFRASCTSSTRSNVRRAASPTTRGPSGSRPASLLELHDDLVVRLGPGIDRGLDAAFRDMRDHARYDGRLEVFAVGALRVGLGLDRDPVALHLDQQVVEVVPVDRAALSGCEIEDPDADAMILEHDLGTDSAELASRGGFGHGREGNRLRPAKRLERVLKSPAWHPVAFRFRSRSAGIRSPFRATSSPVT